MGETEKTGMNDLERKLERMTEDKNAWERKAKLLERANASILYVNDHSSQTMRMIDGRHKEISPLEQTCRAIAHTITEEFSKTGPVECAVSLSVPTIEKDDQGNAKIAVSTYTVKPEDDASWADINAVHLRQGEAFHSEVLPFDHGNALIYLTKKLDACDLEVSEQIKFMNVVKPHFATALANGYGRSKSMHAAEQLTKKFVRGHLGKNYKLDDIGMLPCFFDKRSGVQLLNIVLRSMRNLKEPVSIGLFDVDNFHDYNGAFGHIQGDVALLHLGLTMFQNIHHTHPHNDATIQKLYQELFHPTGPGDQVKEIDYDKQSKICADWKNEVVENLIVKQPRDFLIRYGGGEEFVAVFVGATPEQAKTAAERVCSNIERLVIPAPSTAKMRRQYGPLGLPVGKITASVGISGALPDSPMSAKELIEQADGAVYTAKDMGRNRIVVYNPMTMKPRVREE